MAPWNYHDKNINQKLGLLNKADHTTCMDVEVNHNDSNLSGVFLL